MPKIQVGRSPVELHNSNWDNYNFNKNKLLLESFCVNTDVRLLDDSVLDIDSV